MRRKRPCCRRRPPYCFAPLIVICFGAGLFLSIFTSIKVVMFFVGLCLIILGFYAWKI